MIVFLLDDFFYTLFPELKDLDTKKLVEALEERFTQMLAEKTIKNKEVSGGVKVTLDGEFLTLELQTPEAHSEQSQDSSATTKKEWEDFQKVLSLCDKKRFTQARPILDKLIRNNPTNSEYYRVLGQIYVEQQEFELAFDTLIESLRWNPKNVVALTLVGNIQGVLGNLDQARLFYQQVIQIDPNNALGYNNLGGILMKHHNYQDALKYLQKAYELAPDFPHTSYGLAAAYQALEEYEEAFDWAIRSLKLSQNDPEFHASALSMTFEIVQELTTTRNYTKLIDSYKESLEAHGDLPIEFEAQEDLETNARVENGYVHDREYHRIVYRPSHKTFEHLLMHELTHLDFAARARSKGQNKLFTTNQSHFQTFYDRYKGSTERMITQGIAPERVPEFFTFLFQGIANQLFNTPIDLFIEDRLYTQVPELRPNQLLSLWQLIQEGIQAVTQPSIVKLIPKDVLSTSKVFNLVHGLMFQELYGVVVQHYQANHQEIALANELFGEFLALRSNWNPGIEYDLLLSWAKRMKIQDYFHLIDDPTNRSDTPNQENPGESTYPQTQHQKG